MNEPPKDIELTATVSGSKVLIRAENGDGGAVLDPHSGRHRFNFTLNDQTQGLNVKFYSLDSEDKSSSCPSKQGLNSAQLIEVTIDPPGRASFIDKNDNPAKDGPMNVSYQWNFTCNDPTKQVDPFDPIIRNGGGG